jgi:hypothetical protein
LSDLVTSFSGTETLGHLRDFSKLTLNSIVGCRLAEEPRNLAIGAFELIKFLVDLLAKPRRNNDMEA